MKNTAKKPQREQEREPAREALKRVRSQAMLAARMREQLGREKAGTLRAMRMDGTPTGPRSTSGLDIRLIRQEETERILRREEARLNRIEKKAREAMEDMRPELYAFCALYYVGGMSLADAAKAIDRSERQCLRYKREIEEG